jgi:transposase
LLLLDESGLLLAPLVRRSLAPKGQPAVLEHQAKHRQKVSLIAALTISPKRQHLGLYFSSLINDSFDQDAVAWFLRQVLRHLKGPVIVVWDRGTMHRGPEIRQLLQDHPRLSLEDLPPYAPELNPVEQIWTHLKWNRLCNFAPQDTADLETRVFTELQGWRTSQLQLRTFWNASDLPWPEAFNT